MENSADRFFKGFSLEGYRLQVLINKLEKEKKQCLNRLKEETHVFKMSVKAPVKCGDDCWSQYGEIFHANGDKRENASITRINTEHNNEENENRDASLREAGNNSRSNYEKTSSRMIKVRSESLELHTGVNQTYQRSFFQRTRDRKKIKKDTKEREEPPGLTLLEILCGDFENGALLVKKEVEETDIGSKISPDKLGCKNPKKTQVTSTEVEENLQVSDSDRSMQSEANVESNARSRSSKSGLETTKWRDGDTAGNSNSSIGIRLISVSFEGHNSGSSSLKISPISARCLSSQESVAGQQSPSKIVNWNFKNSINHYHLGETGATLRTGGQLTEKSELFEEIDGLSAPSLDTTQNNNTLFSSDNGLSESGLESQNSENCRFVHFKEGRKPSRRKGRQENCNDRSKGKEKMNRSRSPCVKLFQMEGLQNSQRRKSQDEINKETRQKMDQFFAKVELTKCFQTSKKQRWRCSSGIELNPRRSDRKVSLEPGKQVHRGNKEHGYRRAQPWPTQVWS